MHKRLVHKHSIDTNPLEVGGDRGGCGDCGFGATLVSPAVSSLGGGTPHIFDLYISHFQPNDDPDALLTALGVPQEAFQRSKYQFSRLWKSIREDDDFVREFRLEALRETLTLDYPSYILALAMGAGKTALIGAIYASEFAMAQEYPDRRFVQNALVFAPGKTIKG